MKLVIARLDQHQKALGEAAKNVVTDDPREAIRRTRVHCTNQQSRRNDPSYRLQGRLLTSSRLESAMKFLAEFTATPDRNRGYATAASLQTAIGTLRQFSAESIFLLPQTLWDGRRLLPGQRIPSSG